MSGADKSMASTALGRLRARIAYAEAFALRAARRSVSAFS